MSKKNKIIIAILSAALLILAILIIIDLPQKEEIKQDSLPSIIQNCKEYLYEKDSAKKDRVDYTIYSIEKMSYKEYKAQIFSTDEKVTEENIDDYVMVTIGDTQTGEIGEHDYVVLLVKVKNEVVCGQAPVK